MPSYLLNKLVLSLLSLLIGAALISACGSVSDTNAGISSVRGLPRLVLFSFFIYSIDFGGETILTR